MEQRILNVTHCRVISENFARKSLMFCLTAKDKKHKPNQNIILCLRKDIKKMIPKQTKRKNIKIDR